MLSKVRGIDVCNKDKNNHKCWYKQTRLRSKMAVSEITTMYYLNLKFSVYFLRQVFYITSQVLGLSFYLKRSRKIQNYSDVTSLLLVNQENKTATTTRLGF